jgi:hypothetical protein
MLCAGCYMNFLLLYLIESFDIWEFFAKVTGKIKKHLNLADMKQKGTLYNMIQFMCCLRLILHLFFRHLGIFRGIIGQCICEVGAVGLEAVTVVVAVAVAEVVLIIITVDMVLTTQVVDPVVPTTAVMLPK